MRPAYLDDETLTDNLNDEQATRLLSVLEMAYQTDPDQADLVVMLVRLLNQICADDQERQLFEEITTKLEDLYAKKAK